LPGMAEILTFVTIPPSSSGRSSTPGKAERKIDPGVAAVVAACILAIGGIIGGLVGHFFTGPGDSGAAKAVPTVTVTDTVTASPNGHTSSAPASPTPSSTPTTWFNQLTVAGSGEVTPSGPHELKIVPAQNGNIVTYKLNSRYKTLNLAVGPAPAPASKGITSFLLSLDGTPYALGSSNIAVFGPGDQLSNWIIPVSGVVTLQITVTGSAVSDRALLVSGSLVS
jgi:hypothetical protein